jgi:hypothetical protein
MEDTPKWIPIFFGSIALLIGAFILGARLRAYRFTVGRRPRQIVQQLSPETSK